MQSEKLAELLHRYFEIGVAEGREGRNHDTEAGDAQRVLSEIQAEIAALSTDAEPVKPAPAVAVKALSDAYQKYLDASKLYNERLSIAKTKAPGTMRVDEERAAIDQARRAFDKLAVEVATSAQVQDCDERAAVELGASVLSKIAHPAARETAIRNALTTALYRSAPAHDVAATVEAFDREHPELYWHIAKGKITAGEPLYGAIITDLRGNDLGEGESDASVIEAFTAALDDAGIGSKQGTAE